MNLSIINSTAYGNNTECANWQDIVKDDPVDTVFVQVLFGILYSLVWLLAVFGNILVIYVAVVERISFTVRTVFIVSLAGSDLVVAFTSLPITSVGLFTHQWIFPVFTCYTIGFFQGSSISLSSFTLTAIAVDRYCLILYPHKSVITYSIARNGLFVMFVVGVILAIPMVLFTTVNEVPWNYETMMCGVYCIEDWPKSLHWFKMSYGIAVPALQFGVPLIISTYCYCEIGKQMKIRHRKRQKQEHLLPKTEQKQNCRRRRANRMMAAMVLSFVAAWLPMNFLNIVRDFDLFNGIFHARYFNLLFISGHFLAMTSLIWNPFIYGFFHESFRNTIRNFCRTSSNKLVTNHSSASTTTSKNKLLSTNRNTNSTIVTRHCSTGVLLDLNKTSLTPSSARLGGN